MKTKFTPEYSGTLRSHLLTVPKCISECGGIRIFGRRIKSLVFSTDVAILKNVNADAIIAVYPFTPSPPSPRPSSACLRCRSLWAWAAA